MQARIADPFIDLDQFTGQLPEALVLFFPQGMKMYPIQNGI
jgi:hypothetical protein